VQGGRTDGDEFGSAEQKVLEQGFKEAENVKDGRCLDRAICGGVNEGPQDGWPSDPVAMALAALGGGTHDANLKALSAMRAARSGWKDQNPEGKSQACEKYAEGMTIWRGGGSSDPVIGRG